MDNLVLINKEDKIIIQKAAYIEHGSYIEIKGIEIALWEIPYGGGEPYLVDKYGTLEDAISNMNKLT